MAQNFVHVFGGFTFILPISEFEGGDFTHKNANGGREGWVLGMV